MELTLKKVRCFVRKEIPEKDTTILEDLNLPPKIIKHACSSVSYYRREKEACPFGRGNWIVDLHFKDGDLLCIKLPLEMTKEQVDIFIKPLFEILTT